MLLVLGGMGAMIAFVLGASLVAKRRAPALPMLYADPATSKPDADCVARHFAGIARVEIIGVEPKT